MHGAARAVADETVARMMLHRSGDDSRTFGGEACVYPCERGVAELAQCVAERYAMLEAAARTTALTTGCHVDLEAFHQSAESAQALFELSDILRIQCA